MNELPRKPNGKSLKTARNTLHRLNAHSVMFECPGCGLSHRVSVGTPAGWGFNGSMTRPTFTPSYLVRTEGSRCHSAIVDGWMQFFDDCDHHLAGQRVKIPVWQGV